MSEIASYDESGRAVPMCMGGISPADCSGCEICNPDDSEIDPDYEAWQAARDSVEVKS